MLPDGLCAAARGGVLLCERGEARRVYWDVQWVISRGCGVDGAAIEESHASSRFLFLIY